MNTTKYISHTFYVNSANNEQAYITLGVTSDHTVSIMVDDVEECVTLADLENMASIILDFVSNGRRMLNIDDQQDVAI